ncbi:hypothetical protein BJV82DRAFT_671332 [Fennellomyces sp. T-0311]|nr:hypothetical protein BJV82DRAFT_671332 [Fennellomyces sp. T-0311]
MNIQLTASTNVHDIITNESVGIAPEFVRDESIDHDLYKGTLNEVERDLARWAFKYEVSNSGYKSLATLIQKALTKAHQSSEPCGLSTTSLDEVKKHVKAEANPLINLDIEDFPQSRIEEFENAVGEIHFSHRNIRKVCEHLFSNPAFWNVMINKSTVYKRNGERVYSDLDSGEWWEELQLEYPGHIILTLMLSSDQMIVLGNGRHKAWPLCIKLGNVPMKYRNSDKLKATRVLAYLLVIDWKTGASSPPWLSGARVAIFHYCLSLIMEPFKSPDGRIPAFEMMGPFHKKYPYIPALACYTADLPEQCMLAIVKGGHSTFFCPRCRLPIDRFHLPCAYGKGAEDVLLRIKDYMDILYNHGKQLRNNYRSTEQLCINYSTHVVQNAFSSLSLFDIYGSLVVDDLHQLGGVYRHLVEFVEKMIKERPTKNVILKGISKRASMVAPFQGLRLFKHGYMLSALKNPTYSELKDHMSVSSALFTAFIDFFHLATRKEHTNTTLSQMDTALKKYNKLVPIFEKYSSSKLRFPKHHMLSKYTNDIRRYGVISVYSSCQSEHQHRIDAKRPGCRTNYHKYKMTSQMGNFIHYRDLIYDQYDCNFVTTQGIKHPNAQNAQPIIIRQRQPKLPNDRSFGTLLPPYYGKGSKYYLQPRLPSTRLYGIEANGREYTATSRAHKKFYGHPRYDFAMFEDGSTNRELFHASQSVDLCLVRRFVFSDETHATGFRVLVEPESTNVYDRYVVLQVKDVVRAVHIVPDFATALNDKEEDGIYAKYLWNFDADPSCNVRGSLPELNDLVT